MSTGLSAHIHATNVVTSYLLTLSKCKFGLLALRLASFFFELSLDCLSLLDGLLFLTLLPDLTQLVETLIVVEVVAGL